MCDAPFPVTFQCGELNDHSLGEQNWETNSGLLPVSDRLPVAEPDCSLLSPPDRGECEDGLLMRGEPPLYEVGANLGEVNLAALKPAKLVTVPLWVGTQEYLALVDTGSNASMIQETLVPLDVRTTTVEKVISGIGSDQIVPRGAVELAPSIGGLQLRRSPFLVVAEDAIQYPIILGASFFKTNHITINLKMKRLSGCLGVGHWELYFPSATGPLQTVVRNVPIYAAQQTRVSKAESQLVPVVVDRNYEWLKGAQEVNYYYDGRLSDKLKGKVKGREGVMSLVGAMQVMVHKSSEGQRETDFIKEGDFVGTISTIVEVTPEEESWPADGEVVVEKSVDLSHLAEENRQRVKEMMGQQNEVFSLNDKDFCKAKLTKHKIELHDTTPICQKPRRFPAPIAREIEKQCEELTSLDILEKSRSPWCAPIVPLRKKDGSIRLCIDYRALNRVTKDDRFPMPNVSDLVFSLHGMRVFSTLDLVRGFYQVPLDEASRELTAFSTQRNHYQSKSLCFGLKNAPAAFQREMQEVLREFHERQVVVYIDDILIMSASFEEHLQLVGRVLETLRRYSIKIKPSKCHWFQEEVSFLGHLVGAQGLRKAPAYMKAVEDFPMPVTVKELQSFLGLVNFQRKYIPHCSQLAQPLSRLTGASGRQKLTWTGEMSDAFFALKDAMRHDLSLAYPDYSEGASKLELSTDASGTGVGACLGQIQLEEFRIIAYASMSFSKAQRNYSTLARELAAIRWAVKVFKAFLYGIPFTLYTDHRPLIYMNNMCRVNGRVMRTLNDLADFNFEIKYKAGRDNIPADAMSRMLVKPCEDVEARKDLLPAGLEVVQIIEGGG